MSAVFASGGGIGQIAAPVQIKTSGRDVLASGTVITAGNDNLEFRLVNLAIVLNFQTDGDQPKFGQSTAEGTTLRLTLFNFNNSIGSGTTNPLEIGTYAGRKLLFAFNIYAFSPDSSKTVHYTFMLGDPV